LWVVSKMKHINNMTRKELLEVPARGDYRESTKCDSFVIIPTGKKHESGYGKMVVIACDTNGFPICKVTDFSDVLQLLNYDRYSDKHIHPSSPVQQDEIVYRWRIDCLPESKQIHIWTDNPIEIGSAHSDIDIKCYETKEE